RECPISSEHVRLMSGWIVTPFFAPGAKHIPDPTIATLSTVLSVTDQTLVEQIRQTVTDFFRQPR
ncbi:MAG TPA: hypothetical protein VMM78_01320, partial [Thermomicrobiales bacterium]|nr:hypothetical protein [Thermomicrobiales bacterium]